MRVRRQLHEGNGHGGGAVERAAGVHTREHDDRVVVCTGCSHVVTSSAARTEIAGRHEHTCVNPHGFVYRIGCYQSAPGLVGQGEVTDFHSWFAGYAWQIALCSRCSAHLGWAFSGSEPRFFGLIADRIEERDQPTA
jgi:hypothetical protein